MNAITLSSWTCGVTEFQSAPCCNTLNKCITKMYDRLKHVLPYHIADNQGALCMVDLFIVPNIMVCQGRVRQYGRKSAKPSYIC